LSNLQRFKVLHSSEEKSMNSTKQPSAPPVATTDSQGTFRSPNEKANAPRSGEYSWYSGKVNEQVVREIVRLKREHKL